MKAGDEVEVEMEEAGVSTACISTAAIARVFTMNKHVGRMRRVGLSSRLCSRIKLEGILRLGLERRENGERA